MTSTDQPDTDTYCTTARRRVHMEPVPGTTEQRCPACGLLIDDTPPAPH